MEEKMKLRGLLGISGAIILLMLATGGCQLRLAASKEMVSDLSSNGESWITNGDGSALFQRQAVTLVKGSPDKQYPTIEVNERQTFQSMDGFGFCLTGGSAMLIHRMGDQQRAALLQELFGTEGRQIGTSYLRVSMGSSDLDDHPFSYDDLPAGQTDPSLSNFSLAPDRAYLIPVLKEILAVNPHLKILGSPWSAPVWMKTNHDTRGGRLMAEYYDAYAKYFVKYIQQMAQEGIPIDAITVQNEPLHPGNNPSMYMEAKEQASFIKTSLGPAFAAAHIRTKIIVYDHNCDRPDYPATIYKDPAAAKYVDGAAFHLYAGRIDTLTGLHSAFPTKNLYFTEQWVGAPGNLKEDLAWHVKNLIIGASRNWCKTVLEWNLAADPNYNPHTDRGGCDRCLGAITIDGNRFTRNPAYYIIAHAAKFVRPGSVRIASTVPASLYNVAFKTPAGQKVVIVQNGSDAEQSFNIRFGKQVLQAALKPGAVGTYVW